MPTLPITVVIPAFNEARRIGATLESVAAQTSAPAETIVVDDGSSDGTADVARAAGATVIRQVNGGLSVARNTGISAATQPWIAFLDADDLWLPEKLALQWDALQVAAEAGLAYCDYGYFDDRTGETVIASKLRREAHYAGIPRTRIGIAACVCDAAAFGDAIVVGLFAAPSTLMVRRDVAIAAGMFAPSMRQGEDWDFVLRVAKMTSTVGVELPLMRKRLHAGQLTANLGAQWAAHAAVARRVAMDPTRYPPAARRAFRDRAPRWLEDAGMLFLLGGELRRATSAFREALSYRASPRAAFGLGASWTLRLCGGQRMHRALRGAYRIGRSTVANARPAARVVARRLSARRHSKRRGAPLG